MGVEYKDYYKLLGVSRNASKDEINKAYKKMARQYHPDLNPDNKEAETKFKDINEAHEVLKDDEKRRLYDQLGADWQHGQNFQHPHGFENFNFSYGGPGGSGFDASGFSDFFETLFGGAGRSNGFRQDPFGGFTIKNQRGRDVEADINLTLEEAYSGGRKRISINTGSEQKSLEVNIPAGVRQGARIRLAGQGDAGFGGGKSGDLYMRVNILPHKHFVLDNNNLFYDLNLAPWEAALGAKIRVPTLDGEVELNIPAGSSGGKKLRLKGRGLGGKKDTQLRGDQYVRINIKVPDHITDEEKKLWEQLAAASDFKPRG